MKRDWWLLAACVTYVANFLGLFALLWSMRT